MSGSFRNIYLEFKIKLYELFSPNWPFDDMIIIF